MFAFWGIVRDSDGRRVGRELYHAESAEEAARFCLDDLRCSDAFARLSRDGRTVYSRGQTITF
jgi:hypothetical protein